VAGAAVTGSAGRGSGDPSLREVKFRPSRSAWAERKLQSIKLGGRRFVRRGEVRALIAPPRRVRADHLQPGLFEDLRD
jgi:hypothetical protein